MKKTVQTFQSRFCFPNAEAKRRSSCPSCEHLTDRRVAMILRVKFTVVGTKLHQFPGKRMNVPLKINGWFRWISYWKKAPFLGISYFFGVCVWTIGFYFGRTRFSRLTCLKLTVWKSIVGRWNLLLGPFPPIFSGVLVNFSKCSFRPDKKGSFKRKNTWMSQEVRRSKVRISGL